MCTKFALIRLLKRQKNDEIAPIILSMKLSKGCWSPGVLNEEGKMCPDEMKNYLTKKGDDKHLMTHNNSDGSLGV